MPSGQPGKNDASVIVEGKAEDLDQCNTYHPDEPTEVEIDKVVSDIDSGHQYCNPEIDSNRSEQELPGLKEANLRCEDTPGTMMIPLKVNGVKVNIENHVQGLRQHQESNKALPVIQPQCRQQNHLYKVPSWTMMTCHCWMTMQKRCCWDPASPVQHVMSADSPADELPRQDPATLAQMPAEDQADGLPSHRQDPATPAITMDCHG